MKKKRLYIGQEIIRVLASPELGRIQGAAINTSAQAHVTCAQWCDVPRTKGTECAPDQTTECDPSWDCPQTSLTF